MDDFPGLLARDFGFRPQGKSAPMSASKSTGSGSRSTIQPDAFDDVFGGPPTYTRSASPPLDVFSSFTNHNNKNNSAPKPGPVYDKPVYDDDIFDGVPGLKSSGSVQYDDVFGLKAKAPPPPPAYDDLLDNLGKKSSSVMQEDVKRSDAFDDLIPGFGGSPPQRREAPPETKPTEDPFVILESASSSVGVGGGAFDDIDAFSGLKNASEFRKGRSPPKTAPAPATASAPMERFENVMPTARSAKSFDNIQSPNSNFSDQSEHLETGDEVWLTVAEIPLFTQPTSAPPPSRAPPPLVIKGRSGVSRRDNESYYSYSSRGGSVGKHSAASPIDELEDFAMGKPQMYGNERVENISSEEEIETNSAAAASAAAMKDAMDRAEAKIKQAKEIRDRERDGSSRSARNRESAAAAAAAAQQERDERAASSDAQDFEDKEKQDRERAQREREREEREEQRRVEREEREREREEREEQRRVEREERERERVERQAVERATREARERAAAKVAVEKANAEARQRLQQAAVQRAAAEARDRAAAEARDRANAEAREKAAREKAAVERANAEARSRAERAAVDRAHAEARERAAAAAASAASARERPQKPDDIESFFGGMGVRANSAPKQRATTSENIFDTQTQTRGSADASRRTSSTSSSTIRKATSATNFDDLSTIFGATPSSGDFQEVDGESEERRRSRLERHQRTQERAAKALAEKNERDMQSQRDQAERNRISETLDIEIKRWAAGKEGNLRALLSTMQYVLWPECGWQPVSLTDLITGAAVKKVYRKATLCIHPDKVQQKGANLQQKYIAEKVFDLLKEAWNKFNSEELF